MYFITTKREGYILFCMTPSERGAVGLTEKQVVHLLVRPAVGDPWRVAAQWHGSDHSHTDFLLALRHVEEPAKPEDLLAFAPPGARQ